LTIKGDSPSECRVWMCYNERVDWSDKHQER
jgi:hypothetical protein